MNKDEIKKYFKLLPKDFKIQFDAYRELDNYHFQVLYLPVLLAYYSVFPSENEFTNPDKIFKMKMQLTIDFDSDWFNQSYNIIQHLFLAQRVQANH
jgi:hypothetical protein